jgi:hypothetical protein
MHRAYLPEQQQKETSQYEWMKHEIETAATSINPAASLIELANVDEPDMGER